MGRHGWARFGKSRVGKQVCLDCGKRARRRCEGEVVNARFFFVYVVDHLKQLEQVAQEGYTKEYVPCSPRFRSHELIPDTTNPPLHPPPQTEPNGRSSKPSSKPESNKTSLHSSSPPSLAPELEPVHRPTAVDSRTRKMIRLGSWLLLRNTRGTWRVVRWIVLLWMISRSRGRVGRKEGSIRRMTMMRRMKRKEELVNRE